MKETIKNLYVKTSDDKKVFFVMFGESVIAEFHTIENAEKFMLGQSCHAIIRKILNV